jgi:hypothetical protein
MNFESDEGDDGDYGPDTSQNFRTFPSAKELAERERWRKKREADAHISRQFNSYLIELFNAQNRS